MKECNFFKPFIPTEKKVKAFAKKLKEEYLFLSDELRTYEQIYVILQYYFQNPYKCLVYEIGDFQAIIGFVDVVPGFKATMFFKLLDPKIWGADFVREARGFISEIMKKLCLIRLETASPDPRIVKMAKMVSFKVEGMKEKNFSFDGNLYDDYLLAIVKDLPEMEDKNVLSGQSS